MSTVQTGQIGKFRGRIGQVVVCKWRGIIVGRQRPSKPTKPGIEEQLNQRKKFGSVSNFLKLFSEEIAVGWASDKKKLTAINEAVRYHIEKALKGVYPDYEIDFEKVLISRGRGKIDGGFRPVATAGPDATIDITWITCDSTSRITKPTDLLQVVLVDENVRPDKVLAVHFDKFTKRNALNAKVGVPRRCENHPLHVYIFFSSEDGKLASKSEYLGIVTPQK
jgi:hypothetical protein